MEIFDVIVSIRGVLFLFLFLISILLSCVFRMSKRKNIIIEKATIVLGIFIVVLLFSDSIKDNCIFWERNISKETINLLIDNIEDDCYTFYKNMDVADDVNVIGPYDFYEDYFDMWSVDGDRRVPVELLYEDEYVEIYQSRVWYSGTFVLFPIEPFYYECSIYILRDNEVTGINFSKVSLLFFDVDKMIREGLRTNQGTTNQGSDQSRPVRGRFYD